MFHVERGALESGVESRDQETEGMDGMRRSRSRLILLAASVLTGGTAAQIQVPQKPQPAPAYEVASVRQNTHADAAWNEDFTDDGYRATNETLFDLIYTAYETDAAERWAPRPAWITSTQFDIAAKFDVSLYPKPTLDQRAAMLQRLLVDRFKLALHHEKREYSVLNLVGPQGPKFAESKPSQMHHDPIECDECYALGNSMDTMREEGCTTDDLALYLNATRKEVGRIVVNKTGLTGRYNFALRWTSSGPDGEVPMAGDAPSLVTVVREQLGLKLVPAKAMLDTIVIDQVEMPADN
jgi:uncharacterized protein (TIGR03435 family)